MPRQPRLRDVERIGELAHTSLSVAEEVDDLEPDLVGERVEEQCGASVVGPGSCGHAR